MTLSALVGDYSQNGLRIGFGVGEGAPWDPITRQVIGKSVIGEERPIAQITGQHIVGADLPVIQLTGSQRIYVANALIGRSEIRTTQQLTSLSRIYVANQMRGRLRTAASKPLTGSTSFRATHSLTGIQTIGAPSPIQQLTGLTRLSPAISKQLTGVTDITSHRVSTIKLTGRHRFISSSANVHTGNKVVLKRAS